MTSGIWGDPTVARPRPAAARRRQVGTVIYRVDGGAWQKVTPPPRRSPTDGAHPQGAGRLQRPARLVRRQLRLAEPHGRPHQVTTRSRHCQIWKRDPRLSHQRGRVFLSLLVGAPFSFSHGSKGRGSVGEVAPRRVSRNERFGDSTVALLPHPGALVWGYWRRRTFQTPGRGATRRLRSPRPSWGLISGDRGASLA